MSDIILGSVMGISVGIFLSPFIVYSMGKHLFGYTMLPLSWWLENDSVIQATMLGSLVMFILSGVIILI